MSEIALIPEQVIKVQFSVNVFVNLFDSEYFSRFRFFDGAVNRLELLASLRVRHPLHVYLERLHPIKKRPLFPVGNYGVGMKELAIKLALIPGLNLVKAVISNDLYTVPNPEFKPSRPFHEAPPIPACPHR